LIRRAPEYPCAGGSLQSVVIDRPHPERLPGEIGVALRCLAHPWSLAALALLALNDHMWKGAGPGWLTGKLSDVAGLFYFPFLVAAACALVTSLQPARRVSLPAGRIAFALVAIWFAAAKTIPAAHLATVWLATLVIGPVDVVRDPTDVAALLALVPSWLLYRRVAAAPVPAHRLVQAPVLCLAVLLTAATSRPRTPSVDMLVEHEGTLFAIVMDMPSGGSAQDALGWTAYATADGTRWEPRPGLPRSLVDRHMPRRTLTAGGASFRLAGHELLAERGGREHPVWSVPDGRADFMIVAGGERWSMADIAAVPGTPTVVVALASEGVLVGSGETWTRVAVGPAAPTAWTATPRRALALLRRSQWIFGAASALAAAFLFSVLCWLRPRPAHPVRAHARAGGPVAALRRWLRAPFTALTSVRLDIGCALLAIVGLGCAALVLGFTDGLARANPFALFLSTAPLGLGLCLLVIGWLRHAGRCRERGEPVRLPLLRLPAAAVLGGIVTLGALWAWDIGWVSSLGTATTIAILGVVASALLLHRGKRDSDAELATRRRGVGDTRASRRPDA
jgi:hypothetical protein